MEELIIKITALLETAQRAEAAGRHNLSFELLREAHDLSENYINAEIVRRMDQLRAPTGESDT